MLQDMSTMDSGLRAASPTDLPTTTTRPLTQCIPGVLSALSLNASDIPPMTGKVEQRTTSRPKNKATRPNEAKTERIFSRSGK